jgi:aminocarboxymuconate-semialdehyde decarboxylase
LAVAHLLLAGVLDRHPHLRVHVPHGGGFAPYQKGRLELGQVRRPWGQRLFERPFAEQWAQLSFDSAVHRLDALSFLVATEGSDRVLLGTNFAGWDYDESMTSAIEALDISDEDKQAILGRNAIRIFGIPSS